MINTTNILKPWTSEVIHKQENLIPVMLELKNISKHFKCMENTCKYSCSDADTFFSHLYKHQTIGDSREYLSCCYCSFTAGDIMGFKEHAEVHKKCNFQCPYCFFRGFSQTYVIKHQDLFHKSQPKRVIKCGNEETSVFNLLMDHMHKNVSPYQCPSK